MIAIYILILWVTFLTITKGLLIMLGFNFDVKKLTVVYLILIALLILIRL